VKKIVEFLDSIAEYTGRATSFIIFALLFAVMYEVIARKFFGSPTVWGFEISYMLYAAMFLLGGAHALKYHQHVAIDVITCTLSKRTQAIISIVCYLVFFVPFVLIFIWVTTTFAAQAWANLERSQNPWNQPLYHFKTLMPIGFILLFIQGISEFLKNIMNLKGEGAAK
jgi:TRAP-type mannitol/chloroaromatic compound transport system permease small subunit